MTTPTREQVVQWIQQTNVDLNTLALSEDDTHEIMYVTTLARADLEATLAEQAVELESLRKDAERWKLIDAETDLTPYLREYHSGVCLSVEAIDAAIAAAPKQEK